MRTRCGDVELSCMWVRGHYFFTVNLLIGARLRWIGSRICDGVRAAQAARPFEVLATLSADHLHWPVRLGREISTTPIAGSIKGGFSLACRGRAQERRANGPVASGLCLVAIET